MIDAWGVTPTAGGYLFRNDTANDLFHAVSFGGPVSFSLTFDGVPDPLSAYISRFVFSAYASDGVTALGSPDPVTGALAELRWTPATDASVAGQVTTQFYDQRVSAVPGPGPLLLWAAGLLLLGRRLVRRGPASG